MVSFVGHEPGEGLCGFWPTPAWKEARSRMPWGTGDRQGHRQPWPSTRCALQPAAAWPGGQEGSWQGGRLSLMATLTGYVIYYELSTHEDGMFCLSVAVFLL